MKWSLPQMIGVKKLNSLVEVESRTPVAIIELVSRTGIQTFNLEIDF